MNKVFLNGYIYKEPVAKETSSNVQFCNFTIIVPDIKNPKYENYIFCTAWRSLAQRIVESFKKGQLVSIDGRLRTSSYVSSEDGKKTYSTEVIVDNIQLLNNTRQFNPVNVVSEDNSFESFDYRKYNNQNKQESNIEIKSPIEVTNKFEDSDDWDELDYFTEEDERDE